MIKIIKNCKAFCHSDFINDYYLQPDGSISVLKHLDSVKDLGVTFDSKLKFDHHNNEKVNKSDSIQGLDI